MLDDEPKKTKEPKSKEDRDAINAHTFGQVAMARGSKWAEASMAALHKKERAQALQILQLRQDLERAKATAEHATRELAELKQQMREQTSEPVPRLLPRVGSGSRERPHSREDEAGGLPAIGGGQPPPPREGSRSRSGSREQSREHSRSSAPAAPPRLVAAAARSGESDASAPTRDRLAAKCAELEQQLADAYERCAASERTLAAVQASARDVAEKEGSLRAELDAARAEITRLRQKYDVRIGATSSLQHGLEAKVADRDREIDALKLELGAVEEAVEAARARGFAEALASAKAGRKEVDSEVMSLRRENGTLKSEVRELSSRLNSVGGKIRTLQGQADHTAAEEKSFLKMLSSLQKEQSENDERDSPARAEVAAVGRERRQGRARHETAVGGEGLLRAAANKAPAGHATNGERASRAGKPLRNTTNGAAPPPPPPAANDELHAGAPPGRPPRLTRAEVHSKPVISSAPPLRTPAETRATKRDAAIAEKIEALGAAAVAAASEPASPRAAADKPSRRHARTKHEEMLELDPEAPRRRSAIDALRMRMKAIDLE